MKPRVLWIGERDFNGKKTGDGTCWYPNGDLYVGEMRDDKRNG